MTQDTQTNTGSTTGASSAESAVLTDGLGNEDGYIIAIYEYPKHLLPDFHTALYQLIVGVEQRHNQVAIETYAKYLRELAKVAFVKYAPVMD